MIEAVSKLQNDRSASMKTISELDLSWVDEEPDFGIARGGVYCKSLEELAGAGEYYPRRFCAYSRCVE
jgi:hypothetical protein